MAHPKKFGCLLSSFGKEDLTDWSQFHLFVESAGVKSSAEQILKSFACGKNFL